MLNAIRYSNRQFNVSCRLNKSLYRNAYLNELLPFKLDVLSPTASRFSPRCFATASSSTPTAAAASGSTPHPLAPQNAVTSINDSSSNQQQISVLELTHVLRSERDIKIVNSLMERFIASHPSATYNYSLDVNNGSGLGSFEDRGIISSLLSLDLGHSDALATTLLTKLKDNSKLFARYKDGKDGKEKSHEKEIAGGVNPHVRFVDNCLATYPLLGISWKSPSSVHKLLIMDTISHFNAMREDIMSLADTQFLKKILDDCSVKMTSADLEYKTFLDIIFMTMNQKLDASSTDCISSFNISLEILRNSGYRWENLPDPFKRFIVTKVANLAQLSSLEDFGTNFYFNSETGKPERSGFQRTLDLLYDLRVSREFSDPNLMTPLLAKTNRYLQEVLNGHFFQDSVIDVGLQLTLVSNMFVSASRIGMTYSQLSDKTQYLVETFISENNTNFAISSVQAQGSPKLLFGLGKLKAKYTDFPSSVQTALLDIFLERLRLSRKSPLLITDALYCLNGISLMALKWVDMSQSIKSAVNLSLPIILTSLLKTYSNSNNDERKISENNENDSKVKDRNKGKGDAAAENNKGVLSEVASSSSFPEDPLKTVRIQTSMIMLALARLEVNWTDIPRSTKDNLEAFVTKSINTILSNNIVMHKDDEFGNLIFKNKRQGGSSNYQTKSHSETKFAGTRHIANMIYSLGQIHVNWYDLKPSSQQAISSAGQYVFASYKSDSQDLRTTFHGLGMLGVKWDSIGGNLQSAIVSALTNSLGKNNSYSTSSADDVFDSSYSALDNDEGDEDLGVRMIEKFDSFLETNGNKNVKKMFSSYIHPSVRVNSDLEMVSMVLFTLYRMKYDLAGNKKQKYGFTRSKADVSAESTLRFHDNMFSAILRVLPTCGPGSLGIIVYYLGELGLSWHRISEELKNALLIGIVDLLRRDDASYQDVSRVLYGFGSMRRRGNDAGVVIVHRDPDFQMGNNPANLGGSSAVLDKMNPAFFEDLDFAEINKLMERNFALNSRNNTDRFVLTSANIRDVFVNASSRAIRDLIYEFNSNNTLFGVELEKKAVKLTDNYSVIDKVIQSEKRKSVGDDSSRIEKDVLFSNEDSILDPSSRFYLIKERQEIHINSSELINAIGYFEFVGGFHDNFQVLRPGIEQLINNMSSSPNPQSIIKTLRGLMYLNMEWGSMSFQNRESIVSSIGQLLEKNQLSYNEMYLMISRLRFLGATWSGLTSDVHLLISKYLLNSIIEAARSKKKLNLLDNMSAEEVNLVRTFEALSAIGYNISPSVNESMSDKSEIIRKEIKRSMVSTLFTLDSQCRDLCLAYIMVKGEESSSNVAYTEHEHIGSILTKAYGGDNFAPEKTGKKSEGALNAEDLLLGHLEMVKSSDFNLQSLPEPVFNNIISAVKSCLSLSNLRSGAPFKSSSSSVDAPAPNVRAWYVLRRLRVVEAVVCQSDVSSLDELSPKVKVAFETILATAFKYLEFSNSNSNSIDRNGIDEMIKSSLDAISNQLKVSK